MSHLGPKWSILIPTVVDRPEPFARLADRLAPQVAKAKGQVEVVVFYNNYERQIGVLRQLLLQDARGEYVNFIDDDDLVTEDYVESILPLLDGVDYIGFKVDFYSNGVKVKKPVIHSLECRDWYEDETGFYRRVVHTNPIKRELALLHANYQDSDYKNGKPEDELYHRNMNNYVHTEHFIDKELHIYLQTNDHAWSNFERKVATGRPKLPKYFRFHPRSTT